MRTSCVPVGASPRRRARSHRFRSPALESRMQRGALVANDSDQLRIVEALAEEAVLPAVGPETVAAFEPESVARRRQIREGELGLRPLGTGQRRNTGRAGHGLDEGI